MLDKYLVIDLIQNVISNYIEYDELIELQKNIKYLRLNNCRIKIQVILKIIKK